ncbi:MAG: efflux RND transporter permease subunit [Lentisphaeria bacterium]|nr:efflux RND transporter permease subunit [Lentisphaeria bacterium]
MFSQIFIDRPKLAMVISIVTVIAGLLCVTQAPIAEYPEIAPPTIMVWASYTGASASEVSNTVATVIEEQMNGLENLLYFSSTSSDTGTYMLEITFESGTDTDIALVNVQNAVKRAEPLLPQSVKDNGVRQFKRSGDILSLYNFTTDGSKLSLTELSNFIRTNVRDPLTRIPGVSEVSIMGERNYSMRIWLNASHMAQLGIKTEDVRNAVQSQNIQAAAGSVGAESANDFLQLKLNALGRLDSVEQFSNIIVRSGDGGSQIKLGDIARIELGAENYSNGARLNGTDAISLLIYRNTDANAIDVVDQCNALLEEIKRTQFPEGVDYSISYDPTRYIRVSMAEIFETLIMTLILVVIITWVFLQDWRATLIPVLAIPVSLIGTFIFLIPMGFSINLLTMFGLILVIGSLVDDAIVVTENTIRLIEEENLSPKEAAKKSMKQITGAIIATTLVTVAIYVPVAFYGGMVGTIYMQFAVTMCISLCLSTFNAMTLSPALCGLLLRKPKEQKMFKLFNWTLDWTRRKYLGVSAFMVRYTVVAVLIFAAVIYFNVHYFKTIPSSFIPPEDKGALMGMVDLPPGATLKRTTEALKKAEDSIMNIPGVENIIGITGFSFTSGTGENVGSLIVTLKDWSERTTPETQIGAIQQKVQAAVSQIPEARIVFFQPPAIMGLGVTGGVTFMLQANAGQTPQELYRAMGLLLMELYKLPDVKIAFGNFEATTPQLYLDIDREKAEAMGVPVSRIFQSLQGKIASTYINDFNLLGYSFKVKMQAEAGDRSAISDIEQIMISSNNGDMVPLSAFAEVKRTIGPRLITRFNQLMSAKITVEGKSGVTSHAIMRHIERIVKEKLPKGYQISWTDQSYQERGNEGRIIPLLILAMVFGYLFLVGQYESWTMPISVVLSFAFAMLGGFMGMSWFGQDFSIYAQLGIIMLIGLACKNSILMVELSKQERESGKSVFEAAQNGFSQRYRSVLMTAWSFIIGVFPMVIATGAGAGSRRAIGISTFWGMLLSTIFGIVFVPPLYAFFQNMRERIMGYNKKKKEQD